MILRFDRMLIRVENLPAATAFWQQTHGATVAREGRNSVSLKLRDGGEVLLHTDKTMPTQQMFLLVDDVRAMHADRKRLQLDFRSPPTRGARGYFATIRDPFGVFLEIADLTLEATGGTSGDRLFDDPGKATPDRKRLADLYQELGRTADDLPYTTHFETLYDAYVSGFPAPKPSHSEVWRHLLTTRKRGELPKLGAARSTPPEVDPADVERLRRLLGDDIGKRDRLPYTPRFDELVSEFNRGRRRAFSPHQIWRLVATLAK